MEPKKQRDSLAQVPGGVSFAEKIDGPLYAEGIHILQLI
jgi:hypothetical protein